MDACPLCQGETRRTRLAKTSDRPYRVVRCTRCGTASVLPRPSEQDLADFYGASYFTADTGFGYGDYDGTSWAGAQAVRAWDELQVWAPEVADVPVRTLLDVGAATGEFALRAERDGWYAVACEVGDTARESAAAKGLTTVTTISEATGPFGVISMFHVLEHLIDPLAALVDARGAVDARGVLVIEVPQWNSAGRIVRGSGWAQFRPPEHINFFSRRSLARARRHTGWDMVRSSTPYPHAAELARDAVRRGRVREAAAHAGRHALGSAGLGGYLRTVARPV
ncbi:MAG: methyltransferase domain-containing protein [Dermatophilaceae bacterium]|nr:methyltransferase domain-containing protein [Dermatophilaceae bacterium]